MRGVLIASGGGLKGFSDAINTVYPDTLIQLYIAHMVRNSVKFVPRKDNKLVTADLKQNNQAVTEDKAMLALDRFAER